jgi:hypothetical protein
MAAGVGMFPSRPSAPIGRIRVTMPFQTSTELAGGARSCHAEVWCE